MTNVLIVHGSFGHPNENWFHWLKVKLEKIGCRVFVPQLPTPEGQKLDIWLSVVEEYDKYLDENSIFIAHSMGCALVLRKLEIMDKPVKAVFLVGCPIRDLWKGKYSNIVDTFFEKPFTWGKIKRNSKFFEIYESDNDPLVPLAVGKELAENLNGEFIFVKNAGHFNEVSGYTKFELLYKRVKKKVD